MGRLSIIFVIISGLLLTPLKIFAGEVYIYNEATAIVNKDKKVESTTTIIRADDGQAVRVFNKAVATASSDAGSEDNNKEGFELELKRKPQEEESRLNVEREMPNIIKNHNELRKEIQEQRQQLKSRAKILKKIIGPDYRLITKLEHQLTQIDLTVGQLEEIRNQIPAQEEIEELINSLKQEKVNLENQIREEKQTKSFFGWIFKNLFGR